MPTTSNFGWTTPADTDLVKDGAAAIRTLGNGIDTSFLDLKGGTTGQILSKASATDLDFTWIANDQGDITEVTAGTGISGGGTSGAVTITNSMATAIDAKGDLVAGTGADAFARLAVGANDTVLTADSSTATGLKWATPASGGMTLISSTSLSGSSTSITSIPGTYNSLLVIIYNIGVSATTKFTFRVNNDSGSNYFVGSFATEQLFPRGWSYAGVNNNYNMTQIQIPRYTLTQGKVMNYTIGGSAAGSDAYAETVAQGYKGTSAITSIQIGTGSGGGSFSSGTVELYGVK